MSQIDVTVNGVRNLLYKRLILDPLPVVLVFVYGQKFTL